MKPLPAGFRDAEISQQPECLGSGGAGQSLHHFTESRAREAIEKEMGHDQIVATVLE